MNEMNNEGFALGWDDEFTNEQQEFVLLPEGEYPFEVTQMERARYEGGAKLGRPAPWQNHPAHL